MANARDIAVGINVNTGSWGTGTPTAVAVGAGDGHRVTDDIAGLITTIQQSPEQVAGKAFVENVQAGWTNPTEITLPIPTHYNDAWMNVLWALAVGQGGAPVQQGMTTVYDQTMDPQGGKTGVMATVVVDKNVDIFELPVAKCTGFELTTGEMGRIQTAFSFRGNKCVEDSTTNQAAQISALTYPTGGLRIFARQGVFRINAQTGGALSGSDNLVVDNVTLRYSQPMDSTNIFSATDIIEPEENDWSETVIEVSGPRYNTAWNAFFADHRGTTFHKAELEFTGPTISGEAVAYSLKFSFPNLLLESTPAYTVNGAAGEIVPSGRWRAYAAASAPTGMAGITKPFRISTVGTATTDPLA